jgi:hypothetical protein
MNAAAAAAVVETNSRRDRTLEADRDVSGFSASLMVVPQCALPKLPKMPRLPELIAGFEEAILAFLAILAILAIKRAEAR